MAEKRSIEVPVTLPAKDECKACVVRLKETMEQTKGVLAVDIPERSSTMRVEFDPDLLTLRRLEEQSQDACSRLAATYCHRSLVLGGLDCADCARSIERAVGRRKGVLYATVNFATSRLFLEMNCGDDILDDVRKDVRDLGYQVWTDEEYKEYRRQANPRPFYLRSRRALLTLVSFAFLLVGSAFWVASTPHSTLSIVLLAIATVVGGYSVARDGYYALLRTRNVDMNVLMTVAVIGAAAIGSWVEAALVVALFGFGQTLESWAVERTRGSIQALMDLSPDETLVRDGDHEHVAKVEDVLVGEVVVVKPGARVPMDGEIVKGTSAVDESPITGESLPRAKAIGDLVYAGTINQRGALEVRVTARSTDSTLARLIKMVEEAQGQKAPSQRWVDSFAKYYTPVVMVVALLTAVVPPLLLGQPWSDWIYRALALLILACPCALVISTPVSIVSAIGAASKQGVLIKGGAHLEAAGSLRVVAFDKTGTLTEGYPRVTEVLSFNGGEDGAPGADDLVLALAASVERDSEHPLADAILHAASARGLTLTPVADFEALPGRGAQARLGEQLYLVGNPQLFADLGVPVSVGEADAIEARQRRGETVILLGTHDGALGAISVADEVRPQSREVVKQLHDAGIEQVLMLTGDNRQTAEAVATTLGLDGYRAELMPDQKVGAVRELLDEYGGVAMVGDGINDAPALATAIWANVLARPSRRLRHFGASPSPPHPR